VALHSIGHCSKHTLSQYLIDIRNSQINNNTQGTFPNYTFQAHEQSKLGKSKRITKSEHIVVKIYMGIGRIFSRWGGNSGFFQGQPKRFLQEEAKSGEISFYLIETRKTTFFAKNLMIKCQISKFRRGPRLSFRCPW